MRVCWVLVSAVVLSACGENSGEFLIDLGGNRLEVMRGATGAIVVTLLADDGFDDEVTVRAAVTPETAQSNGPLSFKEQTLSGGRKATIYVRIDPAMSASEFDVEVVAVSTRHRATAQMHVVVKEANGVPDLSFGTSGRAMSDSIGDTDEICAMAPATAELTVLAGIESGEYVLRAFDGAGKPAASFGLAGAVRTGIEPPSEDTPCSLLRDMDGSLLLVGERAGSPSPLFIARFSTSGALDTSYGIALLPAGAQDDALISAVAHPGGGAVVLASMPTTVDSVVTNALVLIQVDSQGKPAAGFGVNGRSEHPESPIGPYAQLAVTADARLLVARYVHVDSTHDNLVLERFFPTGSRDRTYAGGAQSAVVSYGADSLAPSQLLVQPDGKVLVGSRTGPYSHSPFDLRRFSSDGFVDTGFGAGGVVHFMPTATGVEPSASISGLAVGANGRIVAALDYMDKANWGEVRLIRLQPNGAFDTSFAERGQYTLFTNFHAAGYGKLMGASVLSDGRIVTVGRQRTHEQGRFYFATRMLP